MYIYIYVCVYICIYIYRYVCVYIYISIYIYVYMYMYIYMYIYIYICIYIYTTVGRVYNINLHILQQSPNMDFEFRMAQNMEIQPAIQCTAKTNCE